MPRVYNQIQQKKYYEKNKDKLLEKIECECGGTYSIISKTTHFRTNKHKNAIPKKQIKFEEQCIKCFDKDDLIIFANLNNKFHYICNNCLNNTTSKELKQLRDLLNFTM